MLDIEQRREILDAEIAHYTRRGWVIVHRTDTTCLLQKEAIGMGCISVIASLMVLFPFYLENRIKTRSIEVSPEGEILKH